MKNKIFYPIAIACFLSLIFSVLILSEVNMPIIGFLELKSRDFRFLMRGAEKPGDDVVILAIDENSIEKLGRWPWSRDLMAQAITLLKDGGANAIVFDLLFSEAEIKPDTRAINELIAEYTNLGLLDDKPESQAFFKKMIGLSEQKDNDSLMAEAIVSAKNVVLPMVFAEAKSAPDELIPILRQSTCNFPEEQIIPDNFQPMNFNGYLLPISQFTEASPRLGFVNMMPDSDGSVRKSIAVIQHSKSYFLSITIRAIQRHLKLKQKDISILPEKEEIRLGSLIIPIDSQGTFYINHYGANNTIKSYSFSDLLEGRIAPNTFLGKTVFIGGTAIALGDHWANPFGGNIAGVEIQATIADNILTQRCLSRPHLSKYADILTIIILNIILLIILLRLSISRGMLFSAILNLVFIFINQIVFTYCHLILLCVYPILNLWLLTAYICFRRYFIEGREKKFLRQAFKQYISPAVVNRLIESPDKLSLGGEKKELTVLFSDIRKFTSISEALDPEKLVKFLNRYMTDMTKAIMDCEGTLDKYIGDAIMAIYGAPVDQQDHAIRACSSAIKMFDILYRRRDIWKIEKLPPILIGIGINTGEMVVGNIGSEKRFDYTVIGDHVNLASRLESLTKTYGVKIIVSEYTYEQAKDHFEFRELDTVRVRGRYEPLKIFELLGKDYFTQGAYAFIPVFQEGLETYRKCEWEKAIRLFEECLTLKQDDKPSLLYIERCKNMIKAPPTEDWDSVYSCS